MVYCQAVQIDRTETGGTTVTKKEKAVILSTVAKVEWAMNSELSRDAYNVIYGQAGILFQLCNDLGLSEERRQVWESVRSEKAARTG